MIVAFVGSRTFKHTGKIKERLYSLRLTHDMEDITIISGGSGIVDNTSIAEAKAMGFKTNDKDYTPDFSNGYNVALFHERNARIVQDANLVVMFWDGTSKGTRGVHRECMNEHRNHEVIYDE